MHKSRPYQVKLIDEIKTAWVNGFKVPFAVSPTGSGKTEVFSKLALEHAGASCLLAHRDKLVTQISLALARNGIRHRVIGQPNTVKACRRLHLKRLNRSYVDQQAQCGVAGVNTITRLTQNKNPEAWTWLGRVSLWIGDEGHHFLKENVWGRAVKMFTCETLKGLLVSATPSRADGNGLGTHADGLADCLIEAPCLRELIHMGYLVDYKIYTVPSDIDYSVVPVGASGELVHAKLCEAVHASGTFVGDVVSHYLKLAPGKLGITFAVDVASAVEIAQAFRVAGVKAEVVHAETPHDLRNDIFTRYERREVLQLVNVDLLGEGVDFPAAEVVSFARKTESFHLFVQQCGRPLRLLLDSDVMSTWDERTDEQRRDYIAKSAKPHALIIDHVGNVFRHAVMRVDPWTNRLVMDLCHRIWSLDRRSFRTNYLPSDAIPYQHCKNRNAVNSDSPYSDRSGVPCDQPFERFRTVCPHCNFPIPLPPERTAPELVEGDLGELDETRLAELYAKIEGIKNQSVSYHPDKMIQARLHKVARAKCEAQAAIRNALAWYGGLLEARGITELSHQWREFYIRFGIDIGTVQTLPPAEAWAWFGKISVVLAQNNIDATVSAGL